MKRNNHIFMMVFSGLCLALGIAIKNLTFFVPIGIPILKISFDGPAFRLVAVLFGPIYGAIVGGLADFIGFLLTNKSGRGWIPFLTVTYALNICLVGYMWMYFKDRKASKVRVQYLAIVGLILFLGVLSLWLGAKKQAELVTLENQKQAVRIFQEEYIKTVESWKKVEDFAERESKIFRAKVLVEGSQTLITESQLQNSLQILENKQAKDFEANISRETKAAIESIKSYKKELDGMDKMAAKNMEVLYDLAINAIESGENQMKAVRDSRRQMQGSFAVILVGLVGVVIYLINHWIVKNQEVKGIADNFLQMFVTIFIPSILFNWINTYILFTILFQNQKKNLFMFGVFRSAVNLVEVYYNTLIVLFLVVLLNPFLNKRGIYPFGNKTEQGRKM